MKYIWIIMLAIVYIIWLIASLTDFIKTARHIRIKYILDSLEEYTIVFIFLHLALLFGYSLAVFIGGMG